MAWRSVVFRGLTVFTIGFSCWTTVVGEELKSVGPLAVHEWGTFTSVQDELGNAIGGINSDDEPVPGFVHRMPGNLISGPNVLPSLWAKSIPRSHPHVTMRLETPVVYFHPGRVAKLPMQVNVEVAFRGGWLSEYYPKAEIGTPGAMQGSFGPITAATTGQLTWNDLVVGTDADGPETKSPVWLAPREVEAANVTAANGESERYLFYRGVGHVDSPLRVSQNETNQSLNVTSAFPAIDQSKEIELVVPRMWLVEIRADKQCAFRTLEGIRVPNDGRPRVVATTSAKFDDSQFHAANIDELSSSIRAGLIDDGLFADEADALLKTWRASYFESPGLRLFYLLPREWTDHVLPMKLSVDARLVRTMIGRVEIVTPQQRQLLSQIAAAPVPDEKTVQQSLFLEAAAKPEPANVRAYRLLGRFRNALVLDELNRRPSESLQAFVKRYSLGAYVPAAVSAAPPPAAATTTAASSGGQ